MSVSTRTPYVPLPRDDADHGPHSPVLVGLRLVLIGTAVALAVVLCRAAWIVAS